MEREAEHQRYYLKDGTQVSGASGIARLGDSYEGLIHWAWDLGCKGINYKSVRNKAGDAGHIAHFLADCFLNKYDADLREFTAEEIDVGKVMHHKFLDFWGKEGLTIVATEAQMVHEELRYGGTADLVALDDNADHVLIDWKSSKRIGNSQKWQLGGYELLWNFNHPGQEIKRRAIIRTTRDESDMFHAHWIPQAQAESNMEIFKYQAALHNAINNAKRGGKRE